MCACVYMYVHACVPAHVLDLPAVGAQDETPVSVAEEQLVFGAVEDIGVIGLGIIQVLLINGSI